METGKVRRMALKSNSNYTWKWIGLLVSIFPFERIIWDSSFLQEVTPDASPHWPRGWDVSLTLSFRFNCIPYSNFLRSYILSYFSPWAERILSVYFTPLLSSEKRHSSPTGERKPGGEERRRENMREREGEVLWSVGLDDRGEPEGGCSKLSISGLCKMIFQEMHMWSHISHNSPPRVPSSGLSPTTKTQYRQSRSLTWREDQDLGLYSCPCTDSFEAFTFVTTLGGTACNRKGVSGCWCFSRATSWS